MADLFARQLAGDLAVAQHDDAIGAALDLAEPVRDEDDADTIGLERIDDPQEAFRLRERQARRRFVHDHDARVQRQGLGDLDQLALRERQLLQAVGGVEVAAQALEQRPHARVQRLRVDQPERPVRQRLAADEDVGGDVQVLEQVEFLVHEGDARRHRLRHGQAAVLPDAGADHTGVGRDDAAQHLHQRRLARAVLADQADDLAHADGQADTVERHDAGVALADADQFEKRHRHPGSDPGGCPRPGYLPIICFIPAVKASTFDLSITLPGTMMMPSFGTPDLLPSR